MMISISSFKRVLYRFLYFTILLLLFLCTMTIFYKSTLFDQLQRQNNQMKLFDGRIQLDNCSKFCPYSSIFINDTLIFNSSYIIRHFPNFVCPQNFRNLADWVYGWPDQFHEHLELTTNEGKLIAPCLPNGSIIYVRQHAVDNFFHIIYPYLQNDFVLITGEYDNFSPTHLGHLDGPNSKIIHWFGQNGQYHVSKSKKFTHIPIGINCYEMANAIQTVYSQQPNHTIPPIFNDFDELSGYIQPQDVSNRALTTTIPNKDLVLINFNPDSDGTGLRKRIIENMCSEQNAHKYIFVKCISKTSGVHIKKLPKIYERNRQYPFWLSPRGNGIDCHRTWEALYLDIIPIVWNNSLNVLYENLPVVIINDYEELNENFYMKN